MPEFTATTYDLEERIEEVKARLGNNFAGHHVWNEFAPVSILTEKPIDNYTKMQIVDMFPHPVRIYFNGVPVAVSKGKKRKEDFNNIKEESSA